MAPEMLTKYFLCYSGQDILIRSIFMLWVYFCMSCFLGGHLFMPPKKKIYLTPSFIQNRISLRLQASQKR